MHIHYVECWYHGTMPKEPILAPPSTKHGNQLIISQMWRWNNEKGNFSIYSNHSMGLSIINGFLFMKLHVVSAFFIFFSVMNRIEAERSQMVFTLSYSLPHSILALSTLFQILESLLPWLCADSYVNKNGHFSGKISFHGENELSRPLIAMEPTLTDRDINFVSFKGDCRCFWEDQTGQNDVHWCALESLLLNQRWNHTSPPICLSFFMIWQ